MNNKEKMIAGLPYDGSQDNLPDDRLHTWLLLQKYNNLAVSDSIGFNQLIKEILGSTGEKIKVKPPFLCDYGYNIHVGENFFANYGLIILDTARVIIGSNVKIGPNVCLFAAGHPIHPQIRATGIEFGRPISIGDNVWIGGGCIINPGVTIGDNCVIGSGSVVTKDIPSNMIAVGNPCKILRVISDYDKEYYFKNQKYI